MAKLLYVGTRGTDDPTQAMFPFLLAKGAIEAVHEAGIILMGESAPLVKDHIVDQIHEVGVPALRDLVDFIVDHEEPITV